MAALPTIILVHGFWGGAAHWAKAIVELDKLGHKGMRAVEKDFDAATFKAQMVELREALTDARLAMIEAREENAGLQAEIERLKQVAVDRDALLEVGSYKYVGSNGQPVGFPICPKCDATDSRLVKLVRQGHMRGAMCPVCTNSYDPVDCYLPEGGTLVERERQQRNDATRRAIAARPTNPFV